MSSDAGAALPTVPVGGSGVKVTRLVFGGAPIGGLFAPVDDDDALATLEPPTGTIGSAAPASLLTSSLAHAWSVVPAQAGPDGNENSATDSGRSSVDAPGAVGVR